jgi:hypothetical protein
MRLFLKSRSPMIDMLRIVQNPIFVNCYSVLDDAAKSDHLPNVVK